MKINILFIVIIIFIIIANIITQNYLKESEQEICGQLLELRKEIFDNDIKTESIELTESKELREELEQKFNEIYEKWKEKYEKLAYFIEHDELEKVETNLIGLKSYIETKSYSQSIEELDKSVFILKHIGDKFEVNFQNIF